LNTSEQLLAQIRKGDIYTIYLLHGPETFFIDEITSLLMEVVVAEGAKDFDQTLLYGKETNALQIIEACKRYPMMGQRQLVVVREAQYLDKQWETLAQYFENPQPQTVLVLCHKHKKIDARKKVFKALKDTQCIFEAAPLKEYKIMGWIQERAKSYRFDIAPDAANLLFTYLGSDLSKIDKALEKLTNNLASGTHLTPQMIQDHIGYSKDFNSFELQKALGQRNMPLALRIAKYMAENAKNHPVQLILPMLFNYFQKILLYHGLPNRNEAPKRLGISPYFIEEYENAAQFYSLRQSAKVIAVLKEMDLKSKGLGAVNMDNESLLKELIVKIIST